MSKKIIYLDAAATTFMPTAVKKTMVEWCNKGNPSANHFLAKKSKELMWDFKQYFARLCKITLPEEVSPKIAENTYRVIFTSGATESNCFIIESIVNSAMRAYAASRATVRPHLIVSAVEHKSILLCVSALSERGFVDVSYVLPKIDGRIMPADVEAAILPNTVMICVMHANNETGAINDIGAIGKIAQQHRVIFYSDAVQSFGKFGFDPVANSVDAFCVSFHKLHAPPGIGVLVIKEKLIQGYGLEPIIYGSQNAGLRGGTENVPGIGAALAAMEYNFANRIQKNAYMLRIKKKFAREIAARLPTRTFAEYFTTSSATVLHTARPLQVKKEIVFISGFDKNYLPNILLLSAPGICNKKLQSKLEEYGIIVSIGSACNTSNANASHVLEAIRADPLIKKGTLRISFDDTIDEAAVERFAKIFCDLVLSTK